MKTDKELGENAISALKVIHTWAEFRGGAAFNRKDVLDLCKKTLGIKTGSQSEKMALPMSVHGVGITSEQLSAGEGHARRAADIFLRKKR